MIGSLLLSKLHTCTDMHDVDLFELYIFMIEDSKVLRQFEKIFGRGPKDVQW